jgi:hypothetical protein
MPKANTQALDSLMQAYRLLNALIPVDTNGPVDPSTEKGSRCAAFPLGSFITGVVSDDNSSLHKESHLSGIELFPGKGFTRGA